MRLNVGCGGHRLEGHTNIDLYPPADIVGDARTLNFAGAAAIRCDHMLEHVPFREIPSLLARFRTWLTTGGLLEVEVPDMAAIMAAGAADPWWQQYVYGSQDHDGEFHRAGFTADTLRAALGTAGFRSVEVAAFLSDRPQRPSMPCLAGKGHA